MRRIDWIAHFLVVPVLLAGCAVQAEPQGEKTANVSANVFIGTKNRIENDRITAYINVEGKQFPMILDTGAGTKLALFKPVAKALGLELTKLEEAPNFYTTKARIGIGQTGETLSKPLSLMVVDTPIVREHYGVVGWQIIKRSIIELNVPDASWQYHTSLPEDLVEDWQSYPLVEDDHANLMFTVQDGDREILVSLDTGSTGGVSLSKKAWKHWHDAAKPEWVTLDSGFSPATRDFFSVTHKAIASDYHIGEFRLGTVSVEETFAEVRINGDPIGKDKILLGMEAIMARRVVIDGPGKRIYFGPIGQASKEKISLNRSQATFIPQTPDFKQVVAQVIKDGVAYQAGLRDGDIVLMVNGAMAANWREDDSVRPGTVFKKEPGTRVRLLIERDGKRFPVTIELRPSPYDPAPNEE